MRSHSKISISRATSASPRTCRGPTSFKRSTPFRTSTRSTGVSMGPSSGRRGPSFHGGKPDPRLVEARLDLRADHGALVPREAERSDRELRRVTRDVYGAGLEPRVPRLPRGADPFLELAGLHRALRLRRGGRSLERLPHRPVH